MTARMLEVVVDRLVLDGVAVEHAEAVTAAFEQRLAELATAGEAAPRPLRRPSADDPAAIGHHAAASVWHAVGHHLDGVRR